MNIRTRRLFHIDPCCCCCCCCGWSFCWTLFPAVPFWSWLLVCCSFLSHAAASSLRSVAMMKRKDEKIARVTTPITWRTGDTATRSRDHAGIPDKPARQPAKNRLRVYCVAKSYLFSFYTSLPLFWVLSISLQKSSRKWKHSYGTELCPSYVLSKMLENISGLVDKRNTKTFEVQLSIKQIKLLKQASLNVAFERFQQASSALAWENKSTSRLASLILSCKPA